MFRPFDFLYFQKKLKNSQRTDNGITGRILFDEIGHRSHFTMDVLEMSQNGFRKIAYWDATEGVVLTRDISEVYTQISQSLHNKTVSSR